MVASPIPKTREAAQPLLQPMWQLRLNQCHDEFDPTTCFAVLSTISYPLQDVQYVHIKKTYHKTQRNQGPLEGYSDFVKRPAGASASKEGSCFGRHTKQRTQKLRSPSSMFLKIIGAVDRDPPKQE